MIDAEAIEDVYPMSDIQKGMIFHSFKEEEVYHDQMLHQLKIINFQLTTFKNALTLLVEKHTILRTSFSIEQYDEPLQFVHKEITIDYEHNEISDLKSSEQYKFIEDSLKADRGKPFDLTVPGSWRYKSYSLGEDNYAVCFIFHHAIIDGWSNASFSTELHNVYHRLLEESDFSPLPLRSTYKDFIIEQRLLRKDGKTEKFWQKELEDYNRFSFDEIEDNEEFRYLSKSFSSEFQEKLSSYVKEENLTTKTVCYSAFLYCLNLYSYSNDLTTGLITNNRPAIDDGEKILGCFLNTIPFRFVIQKNISWNSFVKQIDSKLNLIKKHDHLSLMSISKIVEESRIKGNPILDVIFNYINFHVYDKLKFNERERPTILNKKGTDRDGLNVNSYERTNFGFAFTVASTGDNFSCTLSYLTSFISNTLVKDFLSYYEIVLKKIVENPNTIIDSREIIPKETLNQLLFNFNTAVDYPREKTIVDLFEEQVKKTPDRVALSYKGKELSYTALNAESNRLAHYLRDRGVVPDQVVSILLEDPIDQIVSILGVLKSGGCYLPIDVTHPTARIEYVLDNSGSAVVITTETVKSEHDQILGSGETILISDIAISRCSEDNLGLVNKSSDLAYIIYTSGTTGQPKGAMIEHGNVVRLFFNDDQLFDFTETDVWTMFHSYSFDFSVWEMYGALLHGGKLVLISREDARDPSAYLQVLKEHQVTILNQTPTAFHNLLTEEKETPDRLLKIRQVIFGGEKLIPTSIRDWKEKYPETQMINMYGITETTVHVTYKELKEDDIASNVSNIGVPIPTTQVYILDEDLNLSIPGVKGEMYVGGSGVCRGYLNNTELTSERFIINPFQEGELIYSTGDLARWLPTGELEYLGRIDSQVQIRGFRIELGEIESQLLSHESIKEVVVLSKSRVEETYLVGYYVSEEEIEPAKLRSYLSEKLPDYMLPAYYVHMDRLPLTSNGKVDRRSLPEEEVKSGDDYVAPRTEKEKILSEIWSKVLGVKSIGIRDNFFTVGGDSIKSIQISSRTRSAGYEVSVKDIFASQTIEELALRLQTRNRVTDQSEVTGEVGLTGIQQWFFGQGLKTPDHYNQSVMLNFPGVLTEEAVVKMFTKLQTHHDGLRMSYREDGGSMLQEGMGIEYPVSIMSRDLSKEQDASGTLLTLCNEVQSSIDLEEGPLMKLGLFKMEDGVRLLIVIHHLVVDGISWRILFEDIETLYGQLMSGSVLSLPLKTDSFKDWSLGIQKYVTTNSFKESWSYWESIIGTSHVNIERDYEEGSNKVFDTGTVGFQLDKKLTDQLLTSVHGAFNTQINDILLSAFLMSIHKSYGHGSVRIDLEGHGREEVLERVDVSRTIGWFTSIYPVVLEQKGGELSTLLKGVKETLRNIPNNGVDYLIGQSIAQSTRVVSVPENRSKIGFNYLGQFDSDTEDKAFTIAVERKGDAHSLSEQRVYDWDITGMTSAGQLGMSLSYSEQQYKKETITTLMGFYEQSLEELITYCCNYGKRELTPSDLTYKGLTIPQLEVLENQYPISDVYLLSPMQEGLLFHSLLDSEADHYFEQISYRLKGKVDITSVEKSFSSLVNRYDILRTVFLHDGYERPIQVVLNDRELAFSFIDIRAEVAAGELDQVIKKYRDKDRLQKFNLTDDILMRVSVYQVSEEEYEFIWSHHHILMDGWCMSILINEFGALYQNYNQDKEIELPPVQPYSRYIEWLEERDKDGAAQYWQEYLKGYESLSSLPDKGELETNVVTKSKDTGLLLTVEQTKLLHQLSSQYGVTLNTIIQSVWGILLSRYNNVNDVVFGAVVSGRPAEISGIETMVGLFINAIPVRIDYQEGDKVSELLQRVQEHAIEGESHHYNSLSDIQSSTELGKGLIDHIMVYENYPIADQIEGTDQKEKNDYIVSNMEMFEQTNYDLSIGVFPGKEIKIDFKYNSHRYDDGMIEGVKVHFSRIVDQIAADCEMYISDIDILSETERHELLYAFNDTAAAYPRDKTLIDLFEEQVEKNPNKEALVFNNEEQSYRQLSDKVNLLAYRMQCAKITKGSIVAIMIDRSFEIIISILATLKLGAAYLPLDVKQPEKRIRFMLTDSHAHLLLTENKNLELYGDQVTAMDIHSEEKKEIDYFESIPFTSGQLAYIIYTSGSTGQPKGVMVEHRSVVNFVHCLIKRYNIEKNENILLFSNVSFDTSVEQMWVSFLTGSSLVLISEMVLLDIELFNDYLIKHKITHLNTTPTFLAGTKLKEGNFLKRVIVGGEKCSLELAKKHSAQYDFFSSYGPTETTVTTHTYLYKEGNHKTRELPLGRQNANTNIYVMDKNNNLQPIGVNGEICIGGECLAKGYLNNQELTDDKFIKNPFDFNEKIYKTGDIGRWLPDGNLEFVGRLGQQIKIRGYRIELEEIEYYLRSYSDIQDATIIAFGNEEKQLVAYYISDEEIATDLLRNFLSENVPDYMVPLHYIYLEKFPLTTNGKLDKNALPTPRIELKVNHIAPSNNAEQKLVAIWSKILGVDESKISVNANFFEIGGTSLKVISLQEKIKKAFDIKVTVATIFRLSTIAALGKFIVEGDTQIEEINKAIDDSVNEADDFFKLIN